MVEGAQRDEWMKRTGPFYPLLVAFRMCSDLPVAADLEPDDGDLRRAAPWIVGVGVAEGLLLAVVGSVLLATPLVPAISATFLIALAVFVTGGFGERGLARSLLRFLGSAEAGSGHVLGIVLVRLAILLGTAPSAWPAALVVSAVAGKLSLMAALRWPWPWPTRSPRPPGSGEGGDSVPGDPTAQGLTPTRWTAAAATGLCAMLAFVGGWAVLYALACLAIGAAARHRSARSSVVVATAELAALLVVAATFPASVSPLVVRP